MAVERKKEKQKTPAELAKEETAKKGPDGGSEKAAKPKAQRAKAGEAGDAAAKAKGSGSRSAKPTAKADAPKPKPKPATRGAARSEPAKPEPAKPEPAKPSAQRPRAPSRRRTPRAEEERRVPERPVVRARAKYVRCSARKVRLVMEHIRGKPIDEARAVLRHAQRSVARDVERLLDSAVANAENNHELVGDELLVKEAYADEGPTLKRFRPRALGRATRIRKRTSHLTLTLTPKD
jgi:ribosomal protein L22